MDVENAVGRPQAGEGVVGHRAVGGEDHERGVGRVRDGPTAIEEMETPASPRTTPTTPIMPGRSSLRTTSMCSDGGTSTVWSSTRTIRGSERGPERVPASE